MQIWLQCLAYIKLSEVIASSQSFPVNALIISSALRIFAILLLIPFAVKDCAARYSMKESVYIILYSPDLMVSITGISSDDITAVKKCDYSDPIQSG